MILVKLFVPLMCMLMNILPLMTRLGRNSHLTKKVANSLKEKLEPHELHDFNEWLKIVDIDQRTSLRASERKGRGY